MLNDIGIGKKLEGIIARKNEVTRYVNERIEQDWQDPDKRSSKKANSLTRRYIY